MSALLYPTLLFEFAVVLALLLVVAAVPRQAARMLAAAETRLAILPTGLGKQLVLVAFAAIALRAALLPWLGAPVPLIHDEHSLLLQARTFLEGRLANPTPALWEYLQTFHVNLFPAYASVYFVGRGLPLVPGLLIAGEPWLGVWLVFVLLAMATVWMLRGYLGPRAALVGGLLVVLRLGAGSYWINSYWGGAFTALGAVLVVGSLGRILRRPRWSYGLLLGLGALILMTTRPYEGAVLCAALGIFVLPRLFKSESVLLRQAALRGGIPLLACVAIGAGATLAYNSATTGDPLLAPYEVNRAFYAEAPAFLMAAPIERDPRALRTPAHFASFYAAEAEPYRTARSSLVGLLGVSLLKLLFLWAFYIGPAMTLPFVAGLYASRRDLPVVGTLAVLVAAHLLTTWDLPHYAAPVFPIVMILIMRGLVVLGRGPLTDRPAGYVLSRGSYLAAGAPLLLLLAHLTSGWPALPSNSWHLSCCAIAQTSPRNEVLERLNAAPGRDLVLVENTRESPIHGEVVWNGPNIDDEPVIFARSMDAEGDRRLIAEYGGRRIWRLRWIEGGYALEPSSPAGASAP